MVSQLCPPFCPSTQNAARHTAVTRSLSIHQARHLAWAQHIEGLSKRFLTEWTGTSQSAGKTCGASRDTDPVPNLCLTCFVSELERSVGLLMRISDLISKPEL